MVKKIDRQELKAALQRKMAQSQAPVRPRQQLGFVHHNVDCLGCRACEIACKDKNDLPPGPRFRRVMYVEGGKFPAVHAYKVNMSCNHCAEPACLPTCPTGAIWKRPDNGVVDIDSTLCIGCRKCEAACPYGAPQWDREAQVVKKCNLCIDELQAGRKPYCVMACLMRALDIGPIEDIWAGNFKSPAIGPKDKPVRRVKDMADPELTRPSIAFVPHREGKADAD